MLAGGARTTTRNEILAKLGIQNAGAAFDVAVSNIKSLILEDGPLSIANALFADSSFTMFPDYARYVDEKFAAYVQNYDSGLAASRDEINRWIADNTNGMIQDMLSHAVLIQSHVVLVNALAFKGAWETEFNTRHTCRGYQFNMSDAKTRRVEMMMSSNEEKLIAHETAYTAVKLPYKSCSSATKLSFVAYLPHPPFSSQLLTKILPSLKDNPLAAVNFKSTKLGKFGLPKMNIDTDVEIVAILQDLGYPIKGNFPEMGAGENEVNMILHSARLKLDEEGTVAAAATAIVMTRSIGRVRYPDVILDRPFAYQIVAETDENDCGIVLFAGIFT